MSNCACKTDGWTVSEPCGLHVGFAKGYAAAENATLRMGYDQRGRVIDGAEARLDMYTAENYALRKKLEARDRVIARLETQLADEQKKRDHYQRRNMDELRPRLDTAEALLQKATGALRGGLLKEIDAFLTDPPCNCAPWIVNGETRHEPACPTHTDTVTELTEKSERLSAAKALLREGSRTGMTVADRTNWMIDARAFLTPADQRVSPLHCDHNGSSASLCTDGTTTFRCPKCGLDLKGCTAEQPTVTEDAT